MSVSKTEIKNVCRYGHPILEDNYCEEGHIRPTPKPEASRELSAIRRAYLAGQAIALRDRYLLDPTLKNYRFWKAALGREMT